MATALSLREQVARVITGMLAALALLATLTASAEAAPHGALRFFEEPGPPPPSGLDPLLGSCDAVRLTEPIGTHKCNPARGLNHARSVDVSPDGRHAYVGSVFSGTIGVFHRDAITGELTQLPGKDGCVDDTGASGCANGRSLTESIFVRVSPDGNHVYATARKSNSVTNNPGCARGRALDGAYSVTVKADRGRENVYVTSRGNDGVATFKRVSGGLRQPPGPAGCITNNTTADCTRTGRGLNGSASLAAGRQRA
jgi:DNA-binding beta-propeller fold protein YncE